MSAQNHQKSSHKSQRASNPVSDQSQKDKSITKPRISDVFKPYRGFDGTQLTEMDASHKSNPESLKNGGSNDSGSFVSFPQEREGFQQQRNDNGLNSDLNYPSHENPALKKLNNVSHIPKTSSSLSLPQPSTNGQYQITISESQPSQEEIKLTLSGTKKNNDIYGIYKTQSNIAMKDNNSSSRRDDEFSNTDDGYGNSHIYANNDIDGEAYGNFNSNNNNKQKLQVEHQQTILEQHDEHLNQNENNNNQNNKDDDDKTKVFVPWRRYDYLQQQHQVDQDDIYDTANNNNVKDNQVGDIGQNTFPNTNMINSWAQQSIKKNAQAQEQYEQWRKGGNRDRMSGASQQQKQHTNLTTNSQYQNNHHNNNPPQDNDESVGFQYSWQKHGIKNPFKEDRRASLVNQQQSGLKENYKQQSQQNCGNNNPFIKSSNKKPVILHDHSNLVQSQKQQQQRNIFIKQSVKKQIQPTQFLSKPRPQQQPQQQSQSQSQSQQLQNNYITNSTTSNRLKLTPVAGLQSSSSSSNSSSCSFHSTDGKRSRRMNASEKKALLQQLMLVDYGNEGGFRVEKRSSQRDNYDDNSDNDSNDINSPMMKDTSNSRQLKINQCWETGKEKENEKEQSQKKQKASDDFNTNKVIKQNQIKQLNNYPDITVIQPIRQILQDDDNNKDDGNNADNSHKQQSYQQVQFTQRNLLLKPSPAAIPTSTKFTKKKKISQTTRRKSSIISIGLDVIAEDDQNKLHTQQQQRNHHRFFDTYKRSLRKSVDGRFSVGGFNSKSGVRSTARSVRIEDIAPSQNAMGSVMHYVIVDGKKSKSKSKRKSDKKQIYQVRRSARVLSKSKKKRQREIEQQRDENDKSDRENPSGTSKSKIKRQLFPATDKSSKSKQQRQRDQSQQSQQVMLEVDWIRNHFQEIEINNAFMYEDYKAMNDNDLEITKLIMELQEKSREYEQMGLDLMVEMLAAEEVGQGSLRNQVQNVVNDGNEAQVQNQQQPQQQPQQQQTVSCGVQTRSRSLQLQKQQRLLSLQRKRKERAMIKAAKKAMRKPRGKTKGKGKGKGKEKENDKNNNIIVNNNNNRKNNKFIEQQKEKLQVEHQQQGQHHYQETKSQEQTIFNHSLDNLNPNSNNRNNSNMLSQLAISSQQTASQTSRLMKRKVFQQTKHRYRIPQQLPLTVESVIDPDINNRGIYAMIKLGKVTEFEMGTKYAVTPITILMYAKKTHVKEVLEQSKKLVPEQYQDNIAYVPLNSELRCLIEKAKRRAEKNQE